MITIKSKKHLNTDKNILDRETVDSENFAAKLDRENEAYKLQNKTFVIHLIQILLKYTKIESEIHMKSYDYLINWLKKGSEFEFHNAFCTTEGLGILLSE
jgi:hypothetical protein